MYVETAAPASIMLHGEWTISRAAERLKLLAGEFAQLFEACPRHARVDINMAGVASVDACGCQLLVVFLENLRRQGIAPEPSYIAPEIMEQVRLLGFADAFAASVTPEKENA
jgi:anti-anti-sigma regulatory factor